MGVLSDWGDALAGPFTSYADTFKTLFTNPSKLKASDIPTLALPIPGLGSTITYDLNHPSAAMYQGSTLALIAGGAEFMAPAAAPAAGAEGSTGVLANSPLMSNVVTGDTAAMDPLADATQGLPSMPGQSSVLINSPLSSNVTADAGWGSLLKGAAKSTASFIKGAAEVSLAARQVAAPWQSAVEKVKDMISGGGGASGGTRIAGGGSASLPSSATPAKASTSLLSSPVVLVGGAALAALAYYAFRPRRSA